MLHNLHLGVSVFELYGVPSQQQIILERQQKIVDRAKEMKQCNIEGATTEELLKRNEDLQAIIDSFETEPVQNEVPAYQIHTG